MLCLYLICSFYAVSYCLCMVLADLNQATADVIESIKKFQLHLQKRKKHGLVNMALKESRGRMFETYDFFY